jgi:hypothetical protein
VRRAVVCELQAFGLGGAGDADWLVQGDVHMPALALDSRAWTQDIAVDPHLVAFADLRTDPRTHAVDHHPALADQAIRLAARAIPGVADVFVEAHEGMVTEDTREAVPP